MYVAETTKQLYVHVLAAANGEIEFLTDISLDATKVSLSVLIHRLTCTPDTLQE